MKEKSVSFSNSLIPHEQPEFFALSLLIKCLFGGKCQIKLEQLDHIHAALPCLLAVCPLSCQFSSVKEWRLQGTASPRDLSISEAGACSFRQHGSAESGRTRGHGALSPGAGPPSAHRPVPLHHGLRVLEDRPAPGARGLRALLQGKPVQRRLLSVRGTSRLSALPAQLPLHRHR